jgi:hypothetical protein
LTVQVLGLDWIFHLVIGWKAVIAISAHARGSRNRLNSRCTRSRAPALTPHADRFRPTVFAWRDLKRHCVPGFERPEAGALNIAEMHEEISVHCFALDEAPPVLESGHNAGITRVVSGRGITGGDARLHAVANAEMGAERAKHLLNAVNLS